MTYLFLELVSGMRKFGAAMSTTFVRRVGLTATGPALKKAPEQTRVGEKRGEERRRFSGLGHRFGGSSTVSISFIEENPGTCVSMVLMVSTCSLRLCCLAATRPSGRFLPPSTIRHFLRYGAERMKGETVRCPGRADGTRKFAG